MARFISRDPFAREALHRKTVHTDNTCSWCGQNYHSRLFVYYIESDNMRRSNIDGYFCSIGCMRAYHNN